MKYWLIALIIVAATSMVTLPKLLRAQSAGGAWEYKMERTGTNVEKAERKLNELSGQGWELINGTDNVMYFRRSANR
jgi:cytochrome c-type biogenesis protein CcmH/NrfG